MVWGFTSLGRFWDGLEFHFFRVCLGLVQGLTCLGFVWAWFRAWLL